MHKRVFRSGLALLLTVLVGFCSFCQPAMALTEEQQLVSQVWKIVNRAYLDETFNHQNWYAVRRQALKKPFKNHQEAYTAIRGMLKTLDDPFTRF